MKLSTKFLCLTLLTISTLFTACDLDDQSQRLLVKASGTPGEIILVMDSVQWKSELGAAMRSVLMADLPGVTRPEKEFTVRYIEPTLFNSVLNKAANIVFVATLDSKTQGGKTVRNYLTENYIEEHPDKFIISQKDIYASGQDVLYLFSATAAELTDRINKNKATIANFFNEKEKERLLYSLYRAKEEIAVSDYMQKKYGFNVRVPIGYRIEADDDGFVWLRSVGEIDKNLFICFRNYTSDKIFEDSQLIGLRDSITRTNVYEDPENLNSFIRVDTIHTETEFEVTKFNNAYAKSIRGIWVANNLTLGGSFLSYIFVDPATNRLYYLDGFVVSPGKNKREPLRELDAILSTFNTSEKSEKIN